MDREQDALAGQAHRQAGRTGCAAQPAQPAHAAHAAQPAHAAHAARAAQPAHAAHAAQGPAPFGLTRRAFVKLAGAGAAAAAAAVAPILAACGSNAAKDARGAGAGAGSDGSQVIIALSPSNEPAAGFDPLYGWGDGEHSHEPLLHSTLVVTTPEMGFANDLATSYGVSDDGLVWTFALRTDARFSDGVPLTAADVAFTLNGIRENDASETDLSMIKRAVAKDDKTVAIELERPYNALLYTLAVIGIVPEHAYGAGYGDNPVGSGRYMLEQWDKGQQVIFKANPGYYGAEPAMKRVVVVFMEEDAALAAVRAGQVDVAATSAVYSTQAVEGYELLACKSVDSRGVSLPVLPANSDWTIGGERQKVGNDVTCDLAVRRAMNYATDRDEMVENVLNGHGSVAYGVSDGMPWSPADARFEASVDAAKAILADGGWASGADGIVVKNGRRASFELCYPVNDSVRQSLANDFANQMRRIGIEVKVSGLSWDDLYPKAYTTPILWGWGSNSPSQLYDLYHSSSSSNFSCYADNDVDASLEAALAAKTVEESFPFWQSAQWDGKTGVSAKGQATWLWLANIDHLYFKRANLVVARQKLHPHGHGWAVANNVDSWQWR